MPKHEYAAYAAKSQYHPHIANQQNISTLNSAKREARNMLGNLPGVCYVWVEDEDCRVVWKKGH